MAKLGKRARAAREAFAGKENLTVEEAVTLLKANATANYSPMTGRLSQKIASFQPNGNILY